MLRFSSSALLSLSSLCVLTACTMDKDYTPPKLEVAEHWNALETNEAAALTVTQAATPESAPWWSQFNDEKLGVVIDKALKNNYDLKVAQARIAEAKANENLAYANFLPKIDATGSLKRSTLGGFLGDDLDTSKQYGLNGEWDIDLFGGNIRRHEAARANVEATEADMAQTRLSLIAEVARNYAHLRGVEQQQALTLRNIDLQDETLRITQGQRDEQMVSELDVLRAQAQVNATKARLPQLKAERYATLNRIAVLLGEKVSVIQELLNATGAIPALPETLVADLPISSIARRPDVKSAERRLAQATAQSGVAFAEFFPKLSLGGFFGRSNSGTFGNLNSWSSAANALFPLMDYGRIQAGVNIADARQQQAYYQFEQKVSQAVSEVESGFSAYSNEIERKQALRQVADTQAQAVTIAREQYLAGIGPQLDLLVAERNALDAESEWVSSQENAALAAIKLFTALGGDEGVAAVESAPAPK